ncbi:hypothetical protein [Proteus mirabilis]|uniref:hypothetical protein n=1 Tax=Proteus mirabilis TaxID=584 RepID=UPI0029E3E549|nr:hypothetical protein [Proteus mirabilis]
MEYDIFLYIWIICLFLILTLCVISVILQTNRSIKLGLKKSELYSQLKTVRITRGLRQEENVYHLKGIVDGVSYDIEVNESEYEFYK